MTHREDDLLAGRLVALADPHDDSDWAEVRRRALAQPLAPARRFRGRRALLIAATFAALVLALGVALAATLSGFSGWLTGKPGSPASPTEQRAFQQANARSWVAFPSGTKLRRLIVARADGSTFRLFGFSSSGEICLRLTVNGANRGALLSCIPRLELVNAKAPAVVSLVDAPAGTARSVLTGRRIGKKTQRIRVLSDVVSFGVTADGVSSVELRVGRGSERAVLANNAFLLIRRYTPFGSTPFRRVSRISAVISNGKRVAIPFKGPVIALPTRFPSSSREKPRYGPTRIDRNPPRRSIDWVLRREPRGLSLSQAHIPSRWLYGYHLGIHFARVIQPDPGNHVRVVITVVGRHSAICIATIIATRNGGGGCVSLRDYPFAPSLYTGGNEQSALISGVVSDAIPRIDLFLNDGQRWPVPLKDNAFVVSVPRIDLPARLVGYDAQGKVVAIQDMTAS